jgi:solute carrier family 25 protein 42
MTLDQHFSNSDLLISGAIAGGLAKTIIAPADRVKINFQTDPHRVYSMRAAVQLGADIAKSGGIRALWRGHLMTLTRVMPYAATNFTVFSRTKDFLVSNFSDHVHVNILKFTAGSISGCTATVLTYPLETFRARMAVDQGSSHSYFRVFSGLVKSEQGIFALYSGLRPTLLGIVPYAGLSFASYEALKKEGFGRFQAGALAGIVAQSATYPLDVIRRRMQVRPGEYVGVGEAVRRIVNEEGVRRGLYKGLSMNWFKGPLAVGVSLSVNDCLKDFIARSKI